MEVKQAEIDEAYKKSLAAVNEWGWRRAIRAMYEAVMSERTSATTMRQNASNAKG